MPSENFADFEVMVQQVIWALKLTPEEWKAHIKTHRLDIFHSIPDPRTGHSRIVGEEFTTRLRKIAKRYLDSNPERKVRTDFASFVEELRKKFSEFFLGTNRAIDEAQMNRWLGSAYRAIAKDHDAAMHYIPCALIFSDTVKEFSVGPVKFYHTADFFRLFGEEIEGLREKIRARHRKRVEESITEGYPAENASTPEQSVDLGNRLTDELLKHYKRFNWFAMVSVPASDKEVSYDRALFATRGALNIIKLLLGAGYTDRLRTADDPGNSGSSATLTRNSHGELDISISSTPLDNVVGDGWLGALGGPFFDLATRVLTLCSAFETAPPLCERFLDALHWFGEAVTEKSRAARIVKFVTAIERICGTGIEKDEQGIERGVTDIVTTRAAILYSVMRGVPYEQAKAQVAKIYDTRSNLVHGSLSPFDETVAAHLRDTYEVTCAILFGALDYYDRIGLEKPTLNENGLKAEFQHLEKWNTAGRLEPPPLAPSV
jgi:hypothetical protein